MTPFANPIAMPCAAIAVLLGYATHAVAQNDVRPSDFAANLSVQSTFDPGTNVSHDRVTAGFGEKTDDFLGRKIAPKKPETQAAGWTLFGQSLSSYQTKKTAAIIVLAISISLLALYLLRMKPGHRRGGLPEDVVSMLGQIPFGPNQKLQLVRLGSKLLLITTSQSGSHTLGEITDPEEVLQIESICRNGKFDTIGQTLRNRAQAASAANTRPRQASAMPGRTLLEA